MSTTPELEPEHHDLDFSIPLQTLTQEKKKRRNAGGRPKSLIWGTHAI